MRLETLLPLGKVDPGLRAPEVPLDLHAVARDARLLEEVGYTGLVVEETSSSITLARRCLPRWESCCWPTA